MNRYLLLILSCLSAISARNFADEQKSEICFFEKQDKIYSSTECYTIIEELGEGLFGKVYAVEDSKGHKFALKSYKENENPFLSASLFAVGEREFLRGQLLNHPCIVKSFDYFSYNISDHASNNLLLQLVEGEMLSKISKGSLTKEQVVKKAVDFCDALRYALALDLIYLDLNENNILVNEEGIVIIDLASFFTVEEILDIADAFKAQKPWIEYPTYSNHIEGQRSTKSAYIDYIEKVSDFCINIFMKSNAGRDEKISMRVEIKKIAWNCAEDANEGKFTSCEDYFDKLIHVMQAI